MKLQQLVESKQSLRDRLAKQYDIVKFAGSTGYSEKNKKWYGWSHRAVCGFGVGDKIFEPNFGDDKTPFVDHGTVTIKNMDDARKAAENFADYVS